MTGFSSFQHVRKYKLERDCRRNVNLLSMQRCPCPIYNGALKTLIRSKMWKITLFSDSKSVYFGEFLRCFLYTRNAQVPFAENPHVKINRLNKKTWISNLYWFRKTFNGTVVNQTLLSLHGIHSKQMHTISLRGVWQDRRSPPFCILGLTLNLNSFV